MQENKVQRERIYNRSKRRKQLMIKRCICLGLLLVMLVGGILLCAKACSGSNDIPKEPVESIPVTAPEETEAPFEGVGDPNNNVYPYSMMSTDWVAEAYEQGWRYYDIPRSYKMAGGMFPEVAQVYLWCICKEAGVDYYMALALIERESGYKYDATGDNGNSKGLMQIQEKWHKDRMKAVGANDLYNPYENMRVGVNFLKELQDRYLDNSGEHCVLMAYNMGASGARKLWVKGIYSTAFTRYIIQRAQEIKQEIEDQ
jgi:hypothetical protein